MYVQKLAENIYDFDEAIKKIKWIENENSLLKSEVNIMHNCSQEKSKTIKTLETKVCIVLCSCFVVLIGFANFSLYKSKKIVF